MLKLKSDEDIAGIRRSCDLLSAMFAELRPLVAAGITTERLDRFARDYIRDHKAIPAFLGVPPQARGHRPFPAALCVSVNDEVIHGIPGRRLLKPGDVVGIDCGINLNGYFSDAAISIPIPPVSPETARLLKVTKECLDLAITAARTGKRISDISRAVFSHAKANGYGVVRQYCGHGVGFSTHEDPQVPNFVGTGPNPRLLPGMVLAIEPMINCGGDGTRELEDGWTVVTRDHSISAHFEHTIAICPSGVEILTSW